MGAVPVNDDEDSYARRKRASGDASDAFMNATSERRRSTVTPTAIIGVLWATHCMHMPTS